jgi:membrane-bound serine protease (ClpP class)
LFYLDPWVIALITVLVILFIVFVVIWTIRTYHQHIYAGKEGLVDKIAIVSEALSPKGSVLIEGELWTAIIDKGSAEPGEEVLVTKVEGLKLRVSKKE